MRRLTFAAALGTSLLFLPLLEAAAQRNCTRGKPCGNTCIAQDRTCRVGTPSSTPTSPPARRPAPAAPPVAPPVAPAPTVAAPAVSETVDPDEELAVAAFRAFYRAKRDSARSMVSDTARTRAAPPDQAGLSPADARRADDAARAQRTAAANDPARRSGGPWVASVRGDTYYRTGCSGGNQLAVGNRIYFQSEAEAQAAGYRRSRSSGC